MNIAVNLETSARFFPQCPVVCEESQDLSYAQLNERANRVASALVRSGLTPGETVGLCAPNSADWLAFYFGVLKAGGVAVTWSHLLRRNELEGMVADIRPRIIYTYPPKIEDFEYLRGASLLQTIIGHGADQTLPQLMRTGSSSFCALERDRNDTAAILFTGGTTGIAKGVMLSHENINTAIHNVVFNERSTAADRVLCFLPFNHVFGQMHILNATVLSGGCLELMPGFDMERSLDILAQGRVTKFYAVPTVYVRLLALEGLKSKLGAIRYCFSAAASLAAESVRQWQEQTGLAIHEAYGMTESASMVTYNHYHRHVVGSVGTPVGTTEIQIRDLKGHIQSPGAEGEICIRGRNIMQGYFNKPEETRSAFWGEWFRSGDLGRIDADGYLYIVDRLKDLIISGGENVYPREVEEVLYGHPDVLECAVIGLPDKQWGEQVTALIVARPGRHPQPKQLADYLKLQLSSFKVPKQYHIVSELPKSAAGKILKRELKKTILGGKL
jgi:long-chain acyl-CoA synthetase